MARLELSIPTLIHGISQQAAELRYAFQGELQENAYPSPVDGLGKRHPTDFIANLEFPTDGDDPLIHLINRSEDERYVVAFFDGDIRVYELDGTEVPVYGTVGPLYTPDFTYLNMVGSRKPSRVLKAVTIADYTLLLNRDTVPGADQLSTTNPTTGTYQALVFVRAGNYKTNYRLDFGQTPDDPILRQAQVATWDGTTAVSGAAEVWEIEVDIAPAATVTWFVTILGQTQPVNILNTDTASQVATKIAAAINLMSNVSAISAGDTVTVTASIVGLDITPTVVDTGGRAVESRVTAGVSGELASIKTDDIAQALMDRVNALGADLGGGYSFHATRSGSVLLIQKTPNDSSEGFEVIASDSTGGTGAAASLFAFRGAVHDFDLLPLTAPHGFKIKVDGDTPDPQDDYYVEFQADIGSGFGPGRWAETTGFEVITAFDKTTLPWSLVRTQDDALGTVTGTPNAKYFAWDMSPWDDRLVGDDVTAPFPSIVSRVTLGYGSDTGTSLPGSPSIQSPISDMVFYRNRLGLVAAQRCVFSETGRFFNFFRTTTRSVPDSDPIDILIPSTSVVRINNALPIDRTLILFSDQGQFVVTAEPTLTAKSIQVSLQLTYAAIPQTDAIPTERGAFFAFSRGNFSGVRELIPSTTVDGQLTADDVSAAVPQYVSGMVLQMAASNHESVLFVLSDGDQSSLWVYKYLNADDGQRQQSAWHQYTMGPNDKTKVYGIGFIDNNLYMVVRRVAQFEDVLTVTTTLESMDVLSGVVDDGADYVTYLDQRVSAGPDTDVVGTYQPLSDTTLWTMPFDMNEEDTYQAVTKSLDGNEGGDVHALTQVGFTTVLATGDLSDEPVWIGRQYEMRYRFSRLFLKKSDSRGTQDLITSGRLQILRGILSYAKSASFRVEVTPLLRDTGVYRFSSNLLSRAVAGLLSLVSGKFSFGVRSRSDTVTIELVNDTPLPSNFQSAEFQVEYTNTGYSAYR